jgi:STAS-like domain of unknown function (DUF4325)
VREVRMARLIELARSLGPVLQGRLLGRKHFGQVCGMLAETPMGETVVLDFNGVEMMTGSWANEMIVPLYMWAADPRNDLFPVLSNLRLGWDEELQLLAGWNQQCYLWEQGREGRPTRTVLIGPLDPVYQKTLEAVLRFKQITGAELERKFPEEGVGATAWNNRLKDLYTKRLLVRAKRGREQVYSPLMDQIVPNG